MSFSGKIKEELVGLESGARHCQIAELAAILVYSRAIRTEKGQYFIEVPSDVHYIEKKRFTILQKTFKMDNVAADDAILKAIKYSPDDTCVNPLVIKSLCCKRSFLRGVFLSIGSMSNPQKGYHLEFVCEDLKQARQLLDTLHVFDIEAKVVPRKRYQVAYIKESQEIVELLNVIGAHVSLMDLENLRILKDMRNSINRRVNCEAANITKTVNAAAKQIEDIEYIKEHYGFDNLSDHLREMAQVRLDYPDAALKELGGYLTPNVGKSGVNHRLRKLSDLAERLRG